MNSQMNEASIFMHRKLNNRLRFLKRRYGNRFKQTVYNFEDRCSYIHYWYSGKWVPDYKYHDVVRERINDYVDKVLENGIWIENTQYFFKNPLDYRLVDYLNWNYKFSKSEIIYSTKIDHNVLCDDYDDFLNMDGWEHIPDYFKAANSQYDSEFEEDEAEDLDEAEDEDEAEDDEVDYGYSVECYGKVWGCPETTNGTQFCCKHYCPYEFCDAPYTQNVLTGENDPWAVDC